MFQKELCSNSKRAYNMKYTTHKFRIISITIAATVLWQTVWYGDFEQPAFGAANADLYLRPMSFSERSKGRQGVVTGVAYSEIRGLLEKFVQKNLDLRDINVSDDIAARIMISPSDANHVEDILRAMIAVIPEATGKRAKGITRKDKEAALKKLSKQKKQLVDQIQAAQRRIQEESAKQQQKFRWAEFERRRQIALWMRYAVCPNLRRIAENNFADFSALSYAGADPGLPNDLRVSWFGFVRFLGEHYRGYQKPGNITDLLGELGKFIELFNLHWLNRLNLLLRTSMYSFGEDNESEAYKMLDTLLIIHPFGRITVRRGDDSVNIVLIESEIEQDTTEVTLAYSPAIGIVGNPEGYRSRANVMWGVHLRNETKTAALPESEALSALAGAGYDPYFYRAAFRYYGAHRSRYHTPDKYIIQIILDTMGEEVGHWVDARDVEKALGKKFSFMNADFMYGFADFKLRPGGLLRQIFDDPISKGDPPGIPLSAAVLRARQVIRASEFFELAGRIKGAFSAQDPNIELVSGLNHLIKFESTDAHVGYITVILTILLAKQWGFIQGEVTPEMIRQLDGSDELNAYLAQVTERTLQADGAEAARLALKAIYQEQYQSIDGSPAVIDEPPFTAINAKGIRVRLPEYEEPLKAALSGLPAKISEVLEIISKGVVSQLESSI